MTKQSGLARREEINPDQELAKCYGSAAYFIHTYCQVYDATVAEWIPFALWPAQVRVLMELVDSQLTIILKARQLGMTWLLLGYGLWRSLFRPKATVMLFSRRDDEAVHLLDYRVKGMYRRLPEWMQASSVVKDNEHVWSLSLGSTVMAFPTGTGDSYTASLVIVDEADLVPDLNQLLRAVKPTIDAGGQMVLLSRADKKTPASEFKNLFRAARRGTGPWKAIFLPWDARPGRTQEWYAEQKDEVFARTGSFYDLWELYPATAEEALAPKSQDKRLPFEWLQRNYKEVEAYSLEALPENLTEPNVRVYELPDPKELYAIGADPAEGNPTSDPSSATVLRVRDQVQVAKLSGQYEPGTFAEHVASLSGWYNDASVLVERNNHGHAVLLWLTENSGVLLQRGLDEKEGWLTTVRGKAAMYDAVAAALRDNETTIQDSDTLDQLASLEGRSMNAPEGQHDDDAVSFALALVATQSVTVAGFGGIYA